MKRLHRDDLYGWSRFDEARNIDFNALLWRRDGGNVLVDPLPMSPHDHAHLLSLGGASLIVVTNSDHTRATAEIAALTGARIAGPYAERAAFPLACDLWLREGDEAVPGLTVLELSGSKTPGELALLIEQTTLVVGDLVRAHRAGTLTTLPTQKLGDASEARASIRRLAALTAVEAVLPGDGWPIFRDGHRALVELAAEVCA